MTLTSFAIEITRREKGKQQVNIAQVLEILKVIKGLLLPMGIDLYKIIHSTESQHHQAIALFNLFGKDRKISFVDALSHVLISGELKNIPALSFDRDFRAMGLTTIS